VQEDVVRAIALFPGVAVTSPGRNDLIVRGGAPFENPDAAPKAMFHADGSVPERLNFHTLPRMSGA
jgi:hypothetical protein